jgi:hypothetical protein
MKKINKNVSDFLLSELCLDNRVEDGTFDIFNNDHMDVLREKLVEMGIPKSEVVELANKVTEGKYPERQAYNANGILVTFPNPEYKQRALRRKTHFEEDPTKGQHNLDFNTPAQPIQQEPISPNETPIEIEPGVQQNTQPSQQDQGSADTSADTNTNTSTDTGTSQTQGQSGVNTNDLENRSGDQKEEDAKEIEKILTTEFSLDEAVLHNWVRDKNRWYNSDGILVGHEWYNVDRHTTTILSVR